VLLIQASPISLLIFNSSYRELTSKMPAYRPPQRRRQESVSEGDDGNQVQHQPAPAAALLTSPRTLEDLVNSAPTLQPKAGHIHLDDIKRHFWPGGHNEHSTLNGGNDEKRDELTFILVFPPGHPKWADEGVLYCKSQLDLLPGYLEQKVKAQHTQPDNDATNDGACRTVEEAERRLAAMTVNDGNGSVANDGMVTRNEGANGKPYTNDAGGSLDNLDESTGHALAHMHSQPAILRNITPFEYKPADHPPIAVFETVRREKGSFRFVGWHTISNISILVPHSKALGEVMEHKWMDKTQSAAENTRNWGKPRPEKSRPAGTWASDLERNWAAVTLTRLDPEDDICPSEPRIETQPHELRSYEGRGGQGRGWRGGSGRAWAQRGPRSDRGTARC
jgi:hypothetical protein